MKAAGNDPRGGTVFEADPVMCARSGQHGFTVRVTPHHPDLVSRFLPGLITWADGARVEAQRVG